MRSIRNLLSVAAIAIVGLGLTACGHPNRVDTLTVMPASQTLNAIGQSVQLKAIGSFTHANSDLKTTEDVTSQVAWTSNNPSVATVDGSGKVTAVANGGATITASLDSGGNVATATSLITVNNGAAGGGSLDLQSMTIIPAAGFQVLTNVGETAQFIAIGTTTNGSTQDVTALVKWQSSDVRVATIDTAGLATGVGCGNPQCKTQITALVQSLSGSTITAVSDLTVLASGTRTLPTLAIYQVGLGSGKVTSVPAGINCVTGAGCTGNFVLNSTVTLTATPDAGSTFGGWSANCTPPTATTCTITMSNNDSVGVIFNK